VGTAKRERQKANKAKREEELARAQAKSRMTRIGLTVAAAIVGVFLLVLIAGQFVGDDDETPTTPVVDGSVPIGTLPPGTIPAGTLPVDSIPAGTPDDSTPADSVPVGTASVDTTPVATQAES
jgi:hypothetical protein